MFPFIPAPPAFRAALALWTNVQKKSITSSEKVCPGSIAPNIEVFLQAAPCEKNTAS